MKMYFVPLTLAIIITLLIFLSIIIEVNTPYQEVNRQFCVNVCIKETIKLLEDNRSYNAAEVFNYCESRRGRCIKVGMDNYQWETLIKDNSKIPDKKVGNETY